MKQARRNRVALQSKGSKKAKRKAARERRDAKRRNRQAKSSGRHSPPRVPFRRRVLQSKKRQREEWHLVDGQWLLGRWERY